MVRLESPSSKASVGTPVIARSSKAKASRVGAAEREAKRQRKGRMIIFVIIKGYYLFNRL
jgi:hypothetical protein